MSLDQSLTTVASEWHAFNEDLTDEAIDDIGGHRAVPYDAPSKALSIGGPVVIIVSPPAFGLKRVELHVANDMIACASHQRLNVSVSRRDGPVASPGGGWGAELPEEIERNSTWLVTATVPDGVHTITVDKVVDQDDGCEPEPEPPDDDCGLGEHDVGMVWVQIPPRHALRRSSSRRARLLVLP